MLRRLQMQLLQMPLGSSQFELQSVVQRICPASKTHMHQLKIHTCFPGLTQLVLFSLMPGTQKYISASILSATACKISFHECFWKG